MKSEHHLIALEKATVRGLSATEMVRMIGARRPRRDAPRLDSKLLRDIGLERSSA